VREILWVVLKFVLVLSVGFVVSFAINFVIGYVSTRKKFRDKD